MLFSYSLIILLGVLFCGIALLVNRRITRYSRIQEKIAELKLHHEAAWRAYQSMLLEDLIRPEFMTSQHSPNTLLFEEHVEGIVHSLVRIQKSEYVRDDVNLLRTLATFKQIADEYTARFSQLKEKLTERGFKDHGMVGKMREYVHALEEMQEMVPLADILMLRRHEKDYLLRKEEKYKLKLQKQAEAMQVMIEGMALDPTTKNRLKNKIQAYYHQFEQITQIDQRIGVSNQEGLKGKLREQAQQMEALCVQLKERSTQKYHQEVNWLKGVLLGLALLIILSCVFITFRVTKVITQPLSALTKAIANSDKGPSYVDKLLKGVSTRDEIGTLIFAFKNMLGEIQESVRSEKEKAAELESLVQENKNRLWINEQSHLLNAILQDPDKEFKEMLNAFLMQLLNSAGFLVGAIYLIDKDEKEQVVLTMEACYAYQRKKFIEKYIYPGEGTVGQSYLEKEAIYLSDVPKDYIQIRSGLGEDTARYVATVPAVFNEQVVAVFELLAFQTPTDTNLQLIQKAINGFAIQVYSKINIHRNKILLQEAREQIASMREREMDLNQTLESLRASYETLERKVNEQKAPAF
ncbi:GAF domain-containing protein [Rapidithrix thailandica]|uniref:GAF domain-containing protein n=1 Tax=Rapidithrix thailandica TaxID=413964 RepID=A0AAW9S1I6_9BACT